MIRIANVSGFHGDRLSAAEELLAGPEPIDVLTGDYLAELTMLILWKARRKVPTPVLRALRPAVPATSREEREWGATTTVPYQLPNLRALNFVVGGILGDGVASSVRPDPQAKALAEIVRAQPVNVPKDLLHRPG